MKMNEEPHPHVWNYSKSVSEMPYMPANRQPWLIAVVVLISVGGRIGPSSP